MDDHCSSDWALKIAAPWADFESGGRDKIKALPGHEVYPLTPDQLAAWRKSAEPIVADWEADGAQGRPGSEGDPRRPEEDGRQAQVGLLSDRSIAVRRGGPSSPRRFAALKPMLREPAMKRSDHRILTTHVGSLIRPKALLEAAKDRPTAASRAAAKREVADIVAHQAKAGIDIVNDGEFGKSGWANYILERLSGFEPRPDKLYPAVWLGRDRIRFADS